MAKITTGDKNIYFEKIKPYRETIRLLLNKEERTLGAIKKNSEGAEFKRLELINDMIYLSSCYIILSSVSQSMLKLKNEEALNDGRRSLYKAVIYLEEVVGNQVDAPFSDYEEKLTLIASVETSGRYLLARRLGLAIDLLENAYGDNTKWKWVFVDLEGRYAAGVKNLIDLKKAVINTDPRSPDYEPMTYHLRLAKKLMLQAADRYREKYELSTGRTDDFKMGIVFLNSLRRLHMILGDREDADVLKKKCEIWSTKLEKDNKRNTADKKTPSARNE